MKIDFSVVLVSIYGEPLSWPGNEGEQATLGRVAVEALMAQFQDENPSGEEKLARFQLARRIVNKAGVDVTPEEVTKIKSLIGKMYTPAVVGPAYELLNG